jgi:hypothetical protein
VERPAAVLGAAAPASALDERPVAARAELVAAAPQTTLVVAQRAHDRAGLLGGQLQELCRAREKRREGAGVRNSCQMSRPSRSASA